MFLAVWGQPICMKYFRVLDQGQKWVEISGIVQQIAGNIWSVKKYLTMLSSGSLKLVREVKLKVKSPAVGLETVWIGESIRPSLSINPDIILGVWEGWGRTGTVSEMGNRPQRTVLLSQRIQVDQIVALPLVGNFIFRWLTPPLVWRGRTLSC